MSNLIEISVIMSVFNGELYLDSAINSILEQSYKNFEFVIIDDASFDRTADILNSYKDKRLKIIKNNENMGLTKSLNKAIDISRGKYIARMDADDISLPLRLEEQIYFLEEHKETGLCGTWFRYIGDNYSYKLPVTHNQITTTLFRTNCIAHPTIMFRRELFDKYKIRYNEAFSTAQDYELFSRCSSLLNYYNIPKILLLYRKHENQVSTSHVDMQTSSADLVRLFNLKRIINDYSFDEQNLHLDLMKNNLHKVLPVFNKAKDWLNRLISANKSKAVYPKREFDDLISSILVDLKLFKISERIGKNSICSRIINKLLRSFFNFFYSAK